MVWSRLAIKEKSSIKESQQMLVQFGQLRAKGIFLTKSYANSLELGQLQASSVPSGDKASNPAEQPRSTESRRVGSVQSPTRADGLAAVSTDVPVKAILLQLGQVANEVMVEKMEVCRAIGYCVLILNSKVRVRLVEKRDIMAPSTKSTAYKSILFIESSSTFEYMIVESRSIFLTQKLKVRLTRIPRMIS